jgi:stage II sporulation protein D
MALLRQFGDRTLRSTVFEVRREGEEYVFEGRGYGHGVGLSQWGAYDLSKQGVGYRQILDFYYTDVHLDRPGSSEIFAGKEEPVITESKPEQTESKKPERSRRVGW